MLSKKHWLIIFGIILVASLVINLSVTLTSPIVFGDEGLYASRAAWIWENKQVPKFYHVQSESDVFKVYFIRPPYMMTLLASVYGIGGEFFLKAILPFVNIITAIVLFLFVKKLYNLEAGVLASLFLIVIPSFITYTIFLYVETVSVLLITASMYFLYIGLTENRKRPLLISAVCAGVAALTDVGGFILPILYILILFIYKNKPREYAKTLIFILLIFLIVISPWYFFHNYLQAKTFGIPVLDRFIGGGSVVITKQLADINEGSKAFGGLGGGGTNDNIIRMGVMNYIDFAYTSIVIAIAAIGFFYALQNRQKKELFIFSWLFLLTAVNFLLTTSSRAEDAARAMVVIVSPLAVLTGLSSEKIFTSIKKIKSIGKYAAVGFVILLLLWSITTTNQKAQSLKPVKQFSTSFFQACDWIKENTESGSLLVTLWQHRAEYACRRDTVWISDPWIDQAVLAKDNRTYDIFKQHGADYIFIQKFSIRPGNEGESYPLEFVNYLANSPNYNLAYETENGCASSGNPDCSIVYKVL